MHLSPVFLANSLILYFFCLARAFLNRPELFKIFHGDGARLRQVYRS